MPVATTEHLEIAQLYVRWPAERSPFAIEFRLDLASQLSMELARGAQQGIEIGGVMLGRMLPGRTPTLRVEAIEMIRRRPEDGSTFLLNPRQLSLFKGICQAAKSSTRTAIGLFRSHLRSELLRPSTADRSLVAEQFGGQPHALLLVQGNPPNTAAFFASDGSELPPEPTISEFRLDASALKTLPEVPADESSAATRPVGTQSTNNSSLWLLGVLAILVAALFVWLAAREPLRASLDVSGNQIHLGIKPSRNVLRINWNHSAREISRAKSAALTIVDGTRRTKLVLDPDDLLFGAVEYQVRSGSTGVSVSMKLDTPAATPVEFARWIRR